jgi:hypothetical protein
MSLGDEVKAKEWCDEHLGADGSGLMEQLPELAPADHVVLEILPGHGHISLVAEFPRLSAELAAPLR